MRRKRPQKTHFQIEPLELRALLTSGLAWTDAPNLTLSFAPDGTRVAGHESSLNTLLGSLGSETDWRAAIRSGFETWTTLVDANIQVVEDGGQAFGASGAHYDDPRFGDIRVAAIPLDDTLYAFSVPHDEFVAGTWAGDIVLNSEADFQSLDDVFRVVLHEAGHVMGLGHSDDPASPMFEHGIPSSITPTDEDRDDLLELYGFEKEAGEGDRTQEESDEDDLENNQLAGAVLLNETDGFPKRRYGLRGRVNDADDVDYYQFKGYEDVDSELEITTFALRSTERGQLVPEITLFDDRGRVIDDVEILQNGNGSLVVQTDRIESDEDYFIRIGSGFDERSQGDYHLTVSSRVEEVEPRDFAEGTLTETTPEELHTIYLSRAQLISFSLEVDDEPVGPNTAVGVAIFDHNGDLIATTSAGAGETRSMETLLLRGGRYYVSIKAQSDTALPDLEYKLLALKVTREAGPLPSDPTEDPAYPCNDGSGDHCYPDGHRSSEPTHTVRGTDGLTTELDQYAIFLSWLSWWPQDNDNAGWVDPNPDQYTVPNSSPTDLDVLGNDTGATDVEVRSVSQPVSGSTTVNADGTVRYAPESGFTGEETFEYTIGAAQAFVDDGSLKAGDRFGSSVAVFGNLAVIGAPLSDANGKDSGAVFIYRRTGGEWQLEQTLTPADGVAGDRFGSSVAIDETIIVVGSPNDDDKGTSSGSAYIFRFDSTQLQFVEFKKLTDKVGRTKDLFGASVDVSGSKIIVGARQDDGGGKNSGSAFVYHRAMGGEDNWGLRKKLKADNRSASAQFGSSVAIDGNTFVIGARSEDFDGTNAGGAYIFHKDAGGTNQYGQVARLSPSQLAAKDTFGASVAIDGDAVVVGSPLSDRGGKNSGGAYIFEQDAGGSNAWGEVAAWNGFSAGDQFGYAVAIDGTLAAVSAPRSDGPSNSGQATLFEKSSGSDWVEDYVVTMDNPAAADLAGSALGLFGGTLVAGVPFSDGRGSRSGHFIVEDTRRTVTQVVVTVGSPLQATQAGDFTSVQQLPLATLQSELESALDYWRAGPINVSIQFADLDGALLGLTVGSRILIDRDAAGHGWASASRRDGVDLTTVVRHELGHVLGRADNYTDPSDIMYGFLEPHSGEFGFEPETLDQLFAM